MALPRSAALAPSPALDLGDGSGWEHQLHGFSWGSLPPPQRCSSSRKGGRLGLFFLKKNNPSKIITPRSECAPPHHPWLCRSSNHFCACTNHGRCCQKAFQIKTETCINGWGVLLPGSATHTWIFPSLAPERCQIAGNRCITEIFHRHNRCPLLSLLYKAFCLM